LKPVMRTIETKREALASVATCEHKRDRMGRHREWPGPSRVGNQVIAGRLRAVSDTQGSSCGLLGRLVTLHLDGITKLAQPCVHLGEALVDGGLPLLRGRCPTRD